MITRKMQVEERTETAKETRFELRHVNPTNVTDDRMTLVCRGVEPTEVLGSVPTWKVGDIVTLTIEGK